MSAADSSGIVSFGPSTVLRERRARSLEYATQSLVCLLRAIVENADAAALGELLGSRPVFQRKGGPPLLLSQFLDTLHQSLAADSDLHSLEIADWAYDQTLARFSHLPEVDSSVKHQGPDCRNYYRAALRKVEVWSQEHQKATQLEEEDVAARILQGLVVKHYHLLECDYFRRPNSPTRRYVWRVGGGHVTLWRPAQVAGGELREWLEAHFPHAAPGRPGEADRIQSEIDAAFPSPRTASWETSGIGAAYRIGDVSPLGQVIRAEQSEEANVRVIRLVDVVAEQKVSHIEEQRPAIRRLGRERLRQLIERVFRDISEETYHDGAIARDFSLSKATFSRFAGSRWSEALGDSDHPTIPDLWRNLARIMAGDPEFLAAAIEAGVMPRLDATLTALGETMGESDDDN